MSERTYVVQKTQIGVESTPGSAVAASKRLQATSLEFEPQATTQEFTPLGSKFPTVVALQKEWMQYAIKGYPAYGDMIYLLSSLFSAPTITAVGTGHKFAFDIAPDALDAPKTFTIEQGDSTRAQRAAGSIVRTMGLKFNRQTVDVSGQAIGKRIEDGVSLTASPADITLEPMLASNFDVFLDPGTGSATPPFGTTKLGRLFDGDWTLDNRFGPFWPVDSSQTSYGGTVETMPAGEFKMIVEADAAGMGLLTTLRNGDTVMVRLRNIGPLLPADVTNHYSFTIDLAMKVHGLGKYSDQEGIEAFEFNLRNTLDSGWGKAIHAEVVQDLAAL